MSGQATAMEILGTGRYPTSFAQRRIWFLHALDPTSPLYNIPCAVRRQGPFALPVFERALDEIVRRHESLRTTFVLGEGEPVQVVGPFRKQRASVVDLRKLPEGQRQLEAQRVAFVEGRAPFDLERGPLLRVSVLQLDEGDQILLFTFHHIVADGGSIQVFFKELEALEVAFANGDPSPLPELEAQYSDYACWQRDRLQGHLLDQHLSYWRKQLVDAPALVELPLDRPRPRVQGFSGATLPVVLERDILEGLKLLCQETGATLFMALLAGFFALLYRFTGQTDIVLGTPIALRQRPEFEPLIGLFVNMLALRADLSDRPTARDFLCRVRDLTIEAYSHQDLPFERLVEELQPERSQAHQPIVQAVLVMQTAMGVPEALAEAAGEQNGSVPSPVPSVAKFDLTLSLAEHGGQLVGGIEFNTDLFDARTVLQLVERLKHLLRGMVRDPSQSVATVPLLSAEEREFMLAGLNRTDHDWEDTGTILDHIWRQGAVNPNEAAIIADGGESITYRVLTDRADAVAAQLIACGPMRGELVPVCFHRSVDLLVALAGILRSGAAYVPIDPDQPMSRTEFMVRDVGAKVALASRPLAGKLPSSVKVLVVADDVDTHTPGSSAPIPFPEPGDVAYAIFTSGSTGQPKCAANDHGALLNRLLWMQHAFSLKPGDRVLQKTPYTFDVSVWELFWPLMFGATVVFARPGEQGDGAYLVDVITRYGISVLHFVPSMLRVVLDHPGVGQCTSLRWVIVSGEALPGDLVGIFYTRLSAELHNLYGPTECAIDVTHWPCRRGLATPVVPIGYPIANVRIYILDPDTLEPVPPGARGELFIAGKAVGRGYINRPELSAASFLPDVLDPSVTMYRSGDVARYRADASIEYLGRADHQIKLRGFRIEAGEVEAALRSVSGVADAVVTLRSAAFGQQLVAHCVPDAETGRVVGALLRCDREGWLRGCTVEEMPNGLAVVARNRSETEFVYQEIFVERAYLRSGIDLRPGDVVLDIGANIGLFALFVGMNSPGAKVYSFEPIPETFEQLAINASLHGWGIFSRKAALGSEAGNGRFTYYPRVSILSGQYADPEEEQQTVIAYERRRGHAGPEVEELVRSRLESRTVDVQVKTLSQVIAEEKLERIDLLKIDAEKSELDVLSGIDGADWPKIQQVVAEVHEIGPRLAQVCEMLHLNGFEVAVEQEASLGGTNISLVFARRPSRGAAQSVAEVPLNFPPSPAGIQEQIRAAVARKLPEYMVPSRIIWVEQLPRLTSGKVDRKSLPPEPEWFGASAAVPRSEPPRTAVEVRIAQIWRETLENCVDFGRKDSFFALGGHSLLATSVIARVRDVFRVEVSLRDFFANPTIAGLAEAIQSGETRSEELLDAIPQVNRSADDVVPLSFSQQRVWFLDQFSPGEATYNIPAVLPLPGPIDEAVLERSLLEIVRRHEILRTCFPYEDGQPVQRVASDWTMRLRRVDVSSMTPALIDDEVHGLAVREIQRPFDLSHCPLFRALLIRAATDRHFLILTMHHTVSDGWSMGVLFRELSAIYEAFSHGLPSPLPELPIQFADFAIWQRKWMTGEVLERQLGYWTEQLAGAPKLLELPTDHLRPAVKSTRGDVLPFHIDPQVQAGLRALAQRENCTLFMVMLTAFNVLFHRLCGPRDFCVGAPIANRRRPELEGLIGFFVNTIVLRTKWTGDPSFRALMHMVRDVTLGAFAHQDMPFEHLVAELEPERAMDRSPIFQVMLILQNITGWDSTGLVESRPVGTGSAKFDLSLFILPAQTGLVGLLEYRTDLFTRQTADCLVQQFCEVLAQAAKTPDAPISRLSLLTPEPRPAGAPVQIADDLIVRLDATDPASPAVLCGSVSTTYGELAQASRDLAARLERLGLRPGDAVAVALPSSVSLLASLVAIRRMGGAYLVIDPEDPPLRKKALLEASGARLLLVSGGFEAAASDFPTLDVSAAQATETALAPSIAGSAERAALIPEWTESSASVHELTASGLSWRLEHSAVREFAGWRVACATPPSTDAALYYLAIVHHGGCLILPGRNPSAAPRTFARALTSNGARVLVVTPELLQVVALEFARSLESVELIVDLADPVQIEPLRAKVSPALLHRCRFRLGIAAFGAVGVRPEGYCNVALEVEAGSLIEVMSGHSAAPLGAFGELAVGGPGLARPRAAADSGAGTPMLRIGVRAIRAVAGHVRLQSGGELFRKAFADVEQAISRIVGGAPTVAACEGAAGGLVAFTLRESGANEASIRQKLEVWLPPSRQPKNIWFTAELPLLPEGGVDIPTLLKHGTTRAAPYAPPRTDLEQGIARIWGEALGVERVGLYDDFFHLGGHSLLASHVIARLGMVLGVEVPLRTLFEYSTLEGLARTVEQMVKSEPGSQAVRLERSSIKGPAPLSFAQQRLWFLNRYEPESAFYNVAGTYRLQGPIDEAALDRALNHIVARHESLRVTFGMMDWEPVQRVEEQVHIPLRTIDMRAMPPDTKRAEAERLRDQIAKEPFQLEKGPLLRVWWIRLADEASILLLCLHHIVADGWSLGILNRELGIAYSALAAGQPVNLPELPLQYTDYARWQRTRLSGEVLARQLSNWRRMLAGAPPLLQLPVDRPRPAVQGFRGGLHSATLDSELIVPLRELSRSERATTFMTLFAAYVALLGRYTGHDDIVVGIPIANRRPELAGMIGLVANTLVLRVSLSGSPSFRELLGRVRTATLEAYEHQDTPFEKLVEELQPARDPSFNPVFQVMFSHQTAAETDAAEPRDTQNSMEMAQTGAAKFDLTMFVMEWTREISLGVEYDAHLFTSETVRRFVENYERMLRSALREPERPLQDLSLLIAGDLPAQATSSRCADWIPGALEALATTHPNRVAVATRETEFTWSDLLARSDVWAAKLRAEGFDPASPVGILLDDPVEEFAAALGVLRAGGASLFLEHHAPLIQIQRELANAGTRLVLSGGSRFTPLAEATAVVTAATPDLPAGSAAAVSPPPSAIAICRGSVKISHAALAASVWAEIEDANLAEGERTVIAEAGALGFHDALAVWLSDGTIVLAGVEERDEVTAFRQLTACAGAARAYLSVGLLRQIAHLSDTGSTAPLRELVVSHPAGLGSELLLKAQKVFGGIVFERLVPPTGLPALRRWAARPEPPRALPRRGMTVQILDGLGNGVPRGLPGKLCQVLPSDAGAGTLLPTEALGRWTSEGAVQILSREAAQLSVRVYDVDRDRVESALRGVSGVQEVAVAVVGQDLVAFIEGNCSEAQAHMVLSEQLPAFMIPRGLVMTPRLPRAASGDVDHSRLPLVPSTERDYASGRTRMERFVLNAFVDAFGRGGVGLEDDFLALGGRCREACAIAASLSERLGTPVDSSAVYLYSTPERLTIALTQQNLAEQGVEVERLLAELESLDDVAVVSLLSTTGTDSTELPDLEEGSLE